MVWKRIYVYIKSTQTNVWEIHYQNKKIIDLYLSYPLLLRLQIIILYNILYIVCRVHIIIVQSSDTQSEGNAIKRPFILCNLYYQAFAISARVFKLLNP